MHHDTIRPADSDMDVTDFWNERFDPENALNECATAFFDHMVIPCTAHRMGRETEFDGVQPVLSHILIEHENGRSGEVSRAQLIGIFGLNEIARLEEIQRLAVGE